MSIFYVLKPGNWAESDDYLCRPLFNPRTSPVPVPFVALASGVADGEYQLIRRQGLSPAQAQAYIQEAQQQLESQNATWQVCDQEGFIFKKPATVRAIVFSQSVTTLNLSDDLSSEQILNPTAIAKAGEYFPNQPLLIVIPKRGWLMVSKNNLAWLNNMSLISNGIFERSSSQEAISPNVFLWEKGRLIGQQYYYKTEKQPSISLAPPDEPATWNF